MGRSKNRLALTRAADANRADQQRLDPLRRFESQDADGHKVPTIRGDSRNAEMHFVGQKGMSDNPVVPLEPRFSMGPLLRPDSRIPFR